jgi:hypothetical protein
VVVDGVTSIQGDGHAVHRAKQDRQARKARNDNVSEMLQVDSDETTGGAFVRILHTSSLLESLVTWKLGRWVRRGDVAKVVKTPWHPTLFLPAVCY